VGGLAPTAPAVWEKLAARVTGCGPVAHPYGWRSRPGRRRGHVTHSALAAHEHGPGLGSDEGPRTGGAALAPNATRRSLGPNGLTARRDSTPSELPAAYQSFASPDGAQVLDPRGKATRPRGGPSDPVAPCEGPPRSQRGGWDRDPQATLVVEWTVAGGSSVRGRVRGGFRRHRERRIRRRKRRPINSRSGGGGDGSGGGGIQVVKGGGDGIQVGIAQAFGGRACGHTAVR
jgi:hypothetical protein